MINQHFDEYKQSAMFIFMHNNSVLLQKSEHQGKIIHDMFGTFLNPGDIPEESIMKRQNELFSTAHTLKYEGTIISYLQKPSGRVKLETRAYSARLTDQELNSLPLDSKMHWVDISEIKGYTSLREDDKIIIERVMHNESLNIIIDIDQMGKWVSAKLLDWETY